MSPTRSGLRSHYVRHVRAGHEIEVTDRGEWWPSSVLPAAAEVRAMISPILAVED
jgi:hypothetical protein